MRSMVEGQVKGAEHCPCPSTTGFAGGPPPPLGEDLQEHHAAISR